MAWYPNDISAMSTTCRSDRRSLSLK